MDSVKRYIHVRILDSISKIENLNVCNTIDGAIYRYVVDIVKNEVIVKIDVDISLNVKEEIKQYKIFKQ